MIQGEDKMYKINTTDFGWSEIDNEFIIYSTKLNTYYVLNETAKYIWEYLYNSVDARKIDDIVQYLDTVYEIVDSEGVRQDVDNLISIFEEMGIVEWVDE